MDFVTKLLILINWKKYSYNLILVIVDQLTKMVHYKPIKITINAFGLAKVIIDVIICQHSLLDLIITNKGFLFILKFYLLLCYFFGTKHRLFIAFYLQIDGQTKKQDSIMEAYLQAFINFN